jgi:peptidoglycan/xylan/chitin deacetylase (PgdA/CDA1 family)
VTVFSFCAFWCDTWKEQEARLGTCARVLRGLPVEFVTVSVDGRWSERGRGKMVGKVLLDTSRALASKLAIHAVPYTVVVDSQGTVRYAAQGIVRAAAVQQVVREIVEDRPATPAGVVYLTFDDFPAAAGDDELLDILRAQGVRATFFCVGQHLAAGREVARRAAREGHALQIHSWDHQAANPRLERCARLLMEIAGAAPTLYRPPGRSRLLRLDGTERPVPTVNPYDFTRPGPDEIVRRVLLAAKPGSVLLLHAGVAETRAALPRIIAGLRQRGLEFGVLR